MRSGSVRHVGDRVNILKVCADESISFLIKLCFNVLLPLLIYVEKILFIATNKPF